MRIEIDTEKKEITILEHAPLSELVSLLKNMFPDDVRKEYKIVPRVVEKRSSHPTPHTQPQFQPHTPPTTNPSPYTFEVWCQTSKSNW